MPTTPSFPFHRLGCDRLVEGSSRVWWHMHPNFRDAGPYMSQLQVSKAGVPTAADWLNVGAPAVNVGELYDSQKRDYGMRLHTFYRVVLTSAAGTYVSNIVSTHGDLNEKDWNFARELIRKEKLRHRVVSRDGYLLRRIRYGEPNQANRDPLTQEVLDSRNRQDYGTGFKGGYFAPVPAQCWDITPETIDEKRNATEVPGQTRNTVVQARVVGFPHLNAEDVWVDRRSDQRWLIQRIQHTAEVRGVPVVMQVTMALIPATSVIYTFEVGGEAADRPGPFLPSNGTGSECIDHDFGGSDALAYRNAAGCGISGAIVRAFLASQYDDGLTDQAYAIAATYIVANGRWAAKLCLDPAKYVLVFEKLGEYGPDAVRIDLSASSSSSSPILSDSSVPAADSASNSSAKSSSSSVKSSSSAFSSDFGSI